MREFLHDFDVKKVFLTSTQNPETKREKINKFEYIKIQTTWQDWVLKLVSKAKRKVTKLMYMRIYNSCTVKEHIN